MSASHAERRLAQKLVIELFLALAEADAECGGCGRPGRSSLREGTIVPRQEEVVGERIRDDRSADEQTS